MKNKFYIDILKTLLILGCVLGVARLSGGLAAILVTIAGIIFVARRKAGGIAFCYIMYPFLINFNHAIVKLDTLLAISVRLGNLLLMILMLLIGARRTLEKIPLSWLLGYCVVAAISSIGGWMPLISYMKLIQFVLFLMGILITTKILQESDDGLYQVRCLMMAIAFIFIVGGFAARFVPSIGYSMSVEKMAAFGIDMTAGELVVAEGMKLFNGMLCHSQMLAPVTSMMAAWVLCDMVLVEKRITLLHFGVLAFAPLLIYMSRSRGGLLEIAAIMGMVVFVCVPKARLTNSVKNKLFMLTALMVVGLIGVAVTAEIKNHTITKWIRKTENVGGDSRTLTEAFTESRQALIEYNLNDFKLNPIFGKGFQVFYDFKQRFEQGRITWYYAPVEKGVTPYVILGETGIVGTIVFVIFLFSFYSTCFRRRYLALMTMFTNMLVCNLADSTFFSPGGLGGLLWITSCVGGFSIDLISIRKAHGVWCYPEMRKRYWGGGNRRIEE